MQSLLRSYIFLAACDCPRLSAEWTAWSRTWCKSKAIFRIVKCGKVSHCVPYTKAVPTGEHSNWSCSRRRFRLFMGCEPPRFWRWFIVGTINDVAGAFPVEVICAAAQTNRIEQRSASTVHCLCMLCLSFLLFAVLQAHALEQGDSRAQLVLNLMRIMQCMHSAGYTSVEVVHGCAWLRHSDFFRSRQINCT